MYDNNDDNIFDALRMDHDKQRELFEKIKETVGDSRKRKTLFKELKEHLEEHAKYEEKYFYSPLMKKEMTIEPSRHAVHEHYKIDSKIEEIEEIDFSSPQWLKKLKELEHLVDHHLKEEEREFFQMAGKVLTKEQKVELGQKYNNDMNS